MREEDKTMELKVSINVKETIMSKILKHYCRFLIIIGYDVESKKIQSLMKRIVKNMKFNINY